MFNIEGIPVQIDLTVLTVYCMFYNLDLVRVSSLLSRYFYCVLLYSGENVFFKRFQISILDRNGVFDCVVNFQ